MIHAHLVTPFRQPCRKELPDEREVEDLAGQATSPLPARNKLGAQSGSDGERRCGGRSPSMLAPAEASRGRLEGRRKVPLGKWLLHEPKRPGRLCLLLDIRGCLRFRVGLRVRVADAMIIVEST